MKTLKIKFGLFSLLAVLSVSVFLTSCQQEEMLNTIDTTETVSKVVENSEFILPYGYDELSAEAQDEYLNSLDAEGFAKLVESSKVATYFSYLGKDAILTSNGEYGDIFNQNTLSLYLTLDEVEGFSSRDFSENIESRGCGDWFNLGQIQWRCTYRYYGSCRRYSCTERQKRVCSWAFDQYRLIYATGC